MIATDAIDPRWPGPCWRLGCCWSPPPSVVRELPDDVTRCCLCHEPVSATETIYILGELVTHMTCGAPVMIRAEVVVCDVLGEAAEGATT